MLGFGRQRKNMSNLFSIDTRIVYINMSLLGTSQGLSQGQRREAVRIIDQRLWNHCKRRRGRPRNS